MFNYLFIFGVGIGIGYSITQSKTIEKDNMLITEYTKEILDRSISWRYARHLRKHDYELSINFK
jgi:hypothetical protein